MKKNLISCIEDVKMGSFSPLEFETPFVEVSYNDIVIFDLSFDGDSIDGDILIMFHHGVVGVEINYDLLNCIIDKAKEKIKNMVQYDKE